MMTETDVEILRREIAEVKSDLTWKLVAMTALFIAAVSALRICINANALSCTGGPSLPSTQATYRIRG